MDAYDIGMVAVGLGLLGAVMAPLVLSGRPLSFPIVYVGLGMVLYSLPVDLPVPDPIAQGELTERLAEMAVIVSLTGAGLKLDRPVGLRTWALTWRLLAVGMPLTIAGAALLGWLLGFEFPAALLLGAALAPTDPVLASDVQVGPPGEEEDEVRFALTSEAGLNDGLAFPFTNAAIAAAGAAGVADWLGDWVVHDVVFKVGVALVVGVVAGRALGWVVFRIPMERKVAESTEGFVALAATLVTYGLAELVGGYGFVAVFVAATVLRNEERGHDYHEVLHASAESIERLLSAALLLLLGGAAVTGALEPLGWKEAVAGLAIVLVVRPVSGLVSLAGARTAPGEGFAISFFGIRGIGSIYYLAYAANQAEFPQIERLWAVVIFVILLSVVIHGVSAAPMMRRIDAGRA